VISLHYARLTEAFDPRNLKDARALLKELW